MIKKRSIVFIVFVTYIILSLSTNVYAATYIDYRACVQNINDELGTGITLPKKGEQLKDGDIIVLTKQTAKGRQMYDITIKANEKINAETGEKYIEYSYEYENVTKEVTDSLKENLKDDNSDNSNSSITNEPTTKAEELLENLDDYKPGKIGEEEAFSKKVGVILGILNIIGFIISVVTIILIGLKYMLGSVEEKASYKKVMIPWLIGAFLVFTVTTLPNILYNIGTSISEDKPNSNGGAYYTDHPNGKPSGTYFEDLIM